MKILVIGNQVRYIVTSGKKGKHEIYAVSYFDSVDQRNCAKISESYIHENVTLKFLSEKKKDVEKFMLEKSKLILENYEIDAIIPKKNTQQIEKFKKFAEIYATPYKYFEIADNKYEQYKIANTLNINVPYTEIINNYEKIFDIAKDIGFPLMIKPVVGSSGTGNIKIENEKDILKFLKKKEKEKKQKKEKKPVIVQEFIEGKNYSINVVSNGYKVKNIFFAEQILGEKFSNSKFPFQYCGNIGYVNFNENLKKEIFEMFSQLILKLNIKGVCGGDFIIDKKGKFYFIEINPRFQGSTDIVEKSLNLSLVDLHISSFNENFEGKNQNFKKLEKIKNQKSSKKVYTSLILYTKKRAILKNDISNKNFICDIPLPNSIFDKNSPIATVIGEGKNREESLRDAKMKRRFVYENIKEY